MQRNSGVTSLVSSVTGFIASAASITKKFGSYFAVSEDHTSPEARLAPSINRLVDAVVRYVPEALRSAEAEQRSLYTDLLTSPACDELLGRKKFLDTSVALIKDIGSWQQPSQQLLLVDDCLTNNSKRVSSSLAALRDFVSPEHRVDVVVAYGSYLASVSTTLKTLAAPHACTAPDRREFSVPPVYTAQELV